MKQTQRDGVGDTTIQRCRDSVAGGSREKMRRRRNGGRERRRHGRGDGVSNRQREEKPERGDELRTRQTETVGRTKPKAGQAGQAGRRRDTQRGCRRTDESRRDTEAIGRRKQQGEGSWAGLPRPGEAEPGAMWGGYWHSGFEEHGAGTKPRGATTLPEGRGEGGGVSDDAPWSGSGSAYGQDSPCYWRKEGTALGQG